MNPHKLDKHEHQWVYSGWSTKDGEATREYLYVCPDCAETKRITLVTK